MAKWTKVPEENVTLLDERLNEIPGVEPRKMFGCPAYFINGNMFAAAHQEDIILRLSEEDQDEAFLDPGVKQFSPMPKMVMKEYVSLPPSIYQSESEFEKWIAKSLAYVSGLPKKEKKPRQ
jgi:TfoX/Sxy family transcriptional regulator of competence genes